MSSRPRSSNGRFGRVGIGPILAAVVGAVALPALGQSATPAATSSPAAELVNQQYVDVSVSGEAGNVPLRVRECPSGATAVEQCKADSTTRKEAGDQRIISTRPDGSGTTPFLIAAGDLKDANGTAFLCDRVHHCDLQVFQLDDNGFETGFDHATPATISFGASTVPCPESTSPGRIAGSGATAPAASVVEWQSELCTPPSDLNVSYAITNSPNGKHAFIGALTDADFAISTIALKPDELDTLKTASRDVVQIPVGVGALGFVYNYYEIVDRCNGNTVATHITNLRLSPPTIIGILTGHITNMSDQAIADDNGDLIAQFSTNDCKPVEHLPSKRIVGVGRADNSGATWTLSSWALANAKDVWESNGPGFQGGPTEIFPAGNGIDLRTGNAAVARDVRTAGGTTDGIPDEAWFGYVDLSVARQLGLPSLAVRSSAGSWVEPTPASIKAGLAAAMLNNDGTVTPNYTPTDQNAYPLVSVSYLVTDKASLTKPKSETMKTFATYATMIGQDAAGSRGYIPISDEMKTSAASQIEQIGFVEDPAKVKKHKRHGHHSTGSSSMGLPSISNNDRHSRHIGGSSTDVAAEVFGPRSFGVAGEGLVDPTPEQLAAISPIEGGPVATQTLGPAGGPAGVVRALTVFLGVPLLVVLGLLCLVIGSADKVFALIGRRVYVRGWRFGWRTT